MLNKIEDEDILKHRLIITSKGDLLSKEKKATSHDYVSIIFYPELL